MTPRLILLPLTVIAGQALASDETRELGAHVHGEGTLNIAVEGSAVAMELAAPGADIVGFEHAAKTDADRAALEAAKATLSDPLALFVLSDAAGCALTSASVTLVAEGGEHGDHGHDDHGHGDEGHDHGDEHAEHGHDDHGHDDHGHDHGDEHAEHGDGEGHTEFRADYLLDCADPSAITAIEFAYFEAFPNAEKLDIQMISGAGSTGFEVSREAPSLDLEGAI